MKNSEFSAEYDRATAEQFRVASDRAKQAAPRALSYLWEIAGDTENSPASRISACRTILEYSLRLSERCDVLERLDALEQRIEEVRQ